MGIQDILKEIDNRIKTSVDETTKISKDELDILRGSVDLLTDQYRALFNTIFNVLFDRANIICTNWEMSYMPIFFYNEVGNRIKAKSLTLSVYNNNKKLVCLERGGISGDIVKDLRLIWDRLIDQAVMLSAITDDPYNFVGYKC